MIPQTIEEGFLINTECMNFLERDLEEIIYVVDNKFLNERNLPIYGTKFRQLRIGNYGIADLVTVSDRTFLGRRRITVYELKEDSISVSAFIQAVGYVKGIKRYIKFRGYDPSKYDIDICLIGRKIDTGSSFVYLSDYFNVNFYTYMYDLDGLYFEPHRGYCLTNENFKK